MVFHSIRWRLQLWHGLILLVVLAGFGFTAHRLQYANELRRVDQELQQRLGPVLEAVRRPPPGGPGGPGRPGGQMSGEGEPDRGERRGPPPRQAGGEFPPPREFRLGPNRAALFEGDTNAFYYVVWGRDGREWSRSATAGGDVPLPERVKEARPAATARLRGTMRELYEFTPPGECVLVGRSIAPDLANQRQLALWLAGLGGAVLMLGLSGGWWLATRAIRPIHDISAAAATIATGNLSHRINTEDTDNELGQLAGVLNSTFARLEAAFERQQQFTADASHELRTPIAVLLSQTQATLARERSPGEYRETLEACQRAAQRMRALTESLLLLARHDSGDTARHREDCALDEVAAETVGLLRARAVERKMTLRTDLQAAHLSGNVQQLGQLITNLVSNAIEYNRPGGEVSVGVKMEGDRALLTVSDTGCGIAPEDLPHIFERFYRADKSRSPADGHAGLGLAICQAIVKTHGGVIEVSSRVGEGTVFQARFPAVAPLPADRIGAT